MMYIKELMRKNNMTRAELSRRSGVPDSTLRDILNESAKLDRCEVLTLICLASALGTTVEDIMEHYWEDGDWGDEEDDDDFYDGKVIRPNGQAAFFYVFAAIVADELKEDTAEGYLHFIQKGNWVEHFYKDGSYDHALLLVGVSDYLCRKLHRSPISEYDRYRNDRLEHPIYPLRLMDIDYDGEEYEAEKDDIMAYAIPELTRFNIFMTEEDIHPKV